MVFQLINLGFKSCPSTIELSKKKKKLLEEFLCEKFILWVRLVAVKRFPENTYFPEMLISGKGKCFPLFGCLGNCFPENQFQCLVRPNILRKSFYGKSIPAFDSSKHFTENTLQKSFYGKSFPVFGLWINFTENMRCVTNWSTCIIYTTL